MTLADINWPLILAGLGLFLFGIDYMGDGLKSYAGDKLKDIIDKYTSSPLKGILIGALVTCLIQSSSGTTALTIGLIRSGLMNLNQAVGIIMTPPGHTVSLGSCHIHSLEALWSFNRLIFDLLAL